jgi:hypothetical protein
MVANAGIAGLGTVLDSSLQINATPRVLTDISSMFQLLWKTLRNCKASTLAASFSVISMLRSRWLHKVVVVALLVRGYPSNRSLNTFTLLCY